jgi:hypothetical protein
MTKFLYFCIFCYYFASVIIDAVRGHTVDPGRGWGTKDNVTWYKGIETGMEQVKIQKKPFMMLFHHSGCYACTLMSYTFSGNHEVWELSKRFVMINVHDDEEPDEDAGYAPDGIYHPRVLFGGPNGKIEKTLHHKDEVYITDVEGDNREFYPDPIEMKYYYPNIESYISGMRRAMKFYGLK